MENKVITVTAPLLPSLDDFLPYLQDIWQRKWLTNNGYYHQELEKALCEYLKVPYISLFTNGTLPLICALQALRITGEVITTPYSFVATTHALWWNGIKPVFVDIDPITCNIDPDKIEAAITPKTTAIMPVHVYGRPCETERIQAIADKYGVTVPQLCIRYTLQLGTLPLPKTENPEHMRDNAKVDFMISDSDMEKLKVVERIKNYGEFSGFPVYGGKM